MNKQEIEKAIELLRNILPKKVSYANLVGASSCYGDEYVYESPEPYAIDLAISALTQQLNYGWIPVSERLPEESIDGITDDYVSYNVSLKFEYAECTRTYKFGQGKWWNDGTDMTEYVVAWQHLPEPYTDTIN